MTEAEKAEIIELIVETLRAELCSLIPVLADMVLREWQDRQRAPAVPPLSAFDEQIAGMVSDIYRNQGQRPASTKAVSVRMGYSQNHMLHLLKQAEEVGAIGSIKGRGARHSGRWLPAVTCS